MGEGLRVPDAFCVSSSWGVKCVTWWEEGNALVGGVSTVKEEA
jgi:hypothetical protein